MQVQFTKKTSVIDGKKNTTREGGGEETRDRGVQCKLKKKEGGQQEQVLWLIAVLRGKKNENK